MNNARNGYRIFAQPSQSSKLGFPCMGIAGRECGATFSQEKRTPGMQKFYTHCHKRAYPDESGYADEVKR